MGCLKGHWSTSHGETSGRAHQLACFAHSVRLRGACTGDWTVGAQALSILWWPSGNHCPWKDADCHPAGASCGKQGSAGDLWPCQAYAQSAILFFMVNSSMWFLVQTAWLVVCFFVTFQDSSQRYVNYNGDNLDTYSDCVKGHLKKKKSKWGFYTWGVELPVNSSGNIQFLYFLASLQSFGLQPST